MSHTPTQIIEGLLGKGANVRATDPVALEVARRRVAPQVKLVENAYAALEGADALFVVTEWNDYRHPDFDRMKSLMKTPVVFDGRNVFAPKKMRELGFTYHGIGRA